MNTDVELLNYIFQNTQMGVNTISQLMDIVEDEEFKKVLKSQYDEYKSIFDKVDARLNEMNKEGKDINLYDKVMAYLMINVKTLTDKSASHIAEMLIQGSTMGIIDITRKIKKYKDADEEILGLAKELLQCEEYNVEQCKKYL